MEFPGFSRKVRAPESHLAACRISNSFFKNEHHPRKRYLHRAGVTQGELHRNRTRF
jgi:hypothetical protein